MRRIKIPINTGKYLWYIVAGALKGADMKEVTVVIFPEETPRDLAVAITNSVKAKNYFFMKGSNIYIYGQEEGVEA